MFIDYFTRDTWIVLLKENSKAFEHFKKIKAWVENEKYLKVKFLRSDGGGVFTSKEFEEFYEEQGIRRQFSVARTPQKKGVVERKNQTIQEMAKEMLDEVGVSHQFWGEATQAKI